MANYPVADETCIDPDLEYKMDLVRDLVSLGRSAREEVQIKVRQPLQEVLIDGAYKETIGDLTELIKEELNVKEIVYQHDLSQYMNFTIKADFRACGKLFGALVKPLATYLSKADTSALMAALNENGSVDVTLGEGTVTLTKDLLDIRITAKEGFNVQMADNLFIILSTN